MMAIELMAIVKRLVICDACLWVGGVQENPEWNINTATLCNFFDRLELHYSQSNIDPTNHLFLFHAIPIATATFWQSTNTHRD